MSEPLQLIRLASRRQAEKPAATVEDLPLPHCVRPRGAYIHIPFCFHKCHYCDFYSIVDSRDRQGIFTDRLIAELAATGPRFERPLETLFVGGGTPTLLAPQLWDRLLAGIREHLPLDDDLEFTVEANPETVTPELTAALSRGGVNRVSIGCQSFNPAHLQALERWHDPANVIRSVSILRDAGIENINLDLIFAIPRQTLSEWESDLSAALALHPTHLSCYGLTYEPNTPMTAKLRSGRLQAADEELEAQMYELAIERLANAGFEHYEISNWARRGDGARRSYRCRHNLLYWTNAEWWAFGPSASAHICATRWKNVPRLGDYIDSAPATEIVDLDQPDEATRAGEALMMGLRLREGIELARLVALLSAPGGDARAAVLRAHEQAGLIERSSSHLRLTHRGLLLADTVLADLI